MGSNLYISASGALARMTQLDLVANNLSNAATTGFKRDDALFEAVLESSLGETDGGVQAGAPSRSFVQTERIASEFEAGPIKTTGSPLDLAILGSGFLEVQTPEGPRYTRAGSLVVDAGGRITTADGFPVMGEGGPVLASGADVHFTARGELQNSQGTSLGRIRIVEFEDLGALQKERHQLFSAGPAAGLSLVASPRVAPGSLEASNVDSVKELGALVLLQRAFEANVRTLQADDQATASLIREVRG